MFRLFTNLTRIFLIIFQIVVKTTSLIFDFENMYMFWNAFAAGFPVNIDLHKWYIKKIKMPIKIAYFNKNI